MKLPNNSDVDQCDQLEKCVRRGGKGPVQGAGCGGKKRKEKKPWMAQRPGLALMNQHQNLVSKSSVRIHL